MASPMKPCPFCCVDRESGFLMVELNGFARVICNECGAAGPKNSSWDDAIETWNDAPRGRKKNG